MHFIIIVKMTRRRAACELLACKWIAGRLVGTSVSRVQHVYIHCSVAKRISPWATRPFGASALLVCRPISFLLLPLLPLLLPLLFLPLGRVFIGLALCIDY